MEDLPGLELVKTELSKLEIQLLDIAMGVAEVEGKLSIKQQAALKVALRQYGLELLEYKTEILVHRIRQAILDAVYDNQAPLLNLSDRLSTKLGYDYTYMSNLFSDSTRVTIEKFYIRNKIERVKQLLLNEGMTLSEIAGKLHYSSLAHLSSQFKKVTGSTPSQFRHESRYKFLPAGSCGRNTPLGAPNP